MGLNFLMEYFFLLTYLHRCMVKGILSENAKYRTLSGEKFPVIAKSPYPRTLRRKPYGTLPYMIMQQNISSRVRVVADHFQNFLLSTQICTLNKEYRVQSLSRVKMRVTSL